jgi:hypothetical protein
VSGQTPYLIRWYEQLAHLWQSTNVNGYTGQAAARNR